MSGLAPPAPGVLGAPSITLPVGSTTPSVSLPVGTTPPGGNVGSGVSLGEAAGSCAVGVGTGAGPVKGFETSELPSSLQALARLPRSERDARLSLARFFMEAVVDGCKKPFGGERHPGERCFAVPSIDYRCDAVTCHQKASSHARTHA